MHRFVPPPAFGVQAGRFFNAINERCDLAFDSLELTLSAPLSFV
jgi:hypothetical protein